MAGKHGQHAVARWQEEKLGDHIFSCRQEADQGEVEVEWGQARLSQNHCSFDKKREPPTVD